MNGKWLLDTNAVIAIWAGEFPIREKLEQGTEVFVPGVVLGELNSDARKSARAEANLARVDKFAVNNTVLACDAVTAQHYGRIRELSRIKGRPIPDDDLWFASGAQQ